MTADNRFFNKIFKKSVNFICGLLGAVKNFFVRTFRLLKRDAHDFKNQSVAFYRDVKSDFKSENSGNDTNFIQPVKSAFRKSKNHKKLFGTLLNYGLPLILIFLSAVAINSEISKTYALKVIYSGVEMGNIKNETVYQDALTKVGNIIMDSEKDDSFLSTHNFKIVYARPSDMIDSDTLAENIISVLDDKLEDASGLFVDGEFIGAMKNESDIRTLLDAIEKMASDYYGGGVAEVNGTLEIRGGMYPYDSVIDMEQLSQRLTGRSFSGLQSNGYMVGGRLSIRVTATKSYTEDIQFQTVEQEEDYLEIGYERVKQEGKVGERYVTASITYVDGREESRDILKSTVLEEPIEEIKIVGTRMPESAERIATVFSGKFIWPIGSGYISSGFMTAERPTHKAIDIAAAAGTDIYAAEAGTITFAGFSDDGGGLNVIMEHDNGFGTRYAHCSALYVTEGQSVVKGQIIAAVGKSGNATGNHLHFEIRYNGYRIDPLPFLPR